MRGRQRRRKGCQGTRSGNSMAEKSERESERERRKRGRQEEEKSSFSSYVHVSVLNVLLV